MNCQTGLVRFLKRIIIVLLHFTVLMFSLRLYRRAQWRSDNVLTSDDAMKDKRPPLGQSVQH